MKPVHGGHNYEKYYRVTKNDIVLCCGSSNGDVSYYFAKRARHVICIEPCPYNLFHLRNRLAGMDNVEFYPIALWNTTGERPFYLSYKNLNQHTLKKEWLPGFHGAKIIVKTDTIDNIVASSRYGYVDVIKMDIEGAEVEALTGATRTLKGCKYVAVATYHRIGGGTTSGRVAEILMQSGFHIRIHKDPEELTYGVR